MRISFGCEHLLCFLRMIGMQLAINSTAVFYMFLPESRYDPVKQQRVIVRYEQCQRRLVIESLGMAPLVQTSASH